MLVGLGCALGAALLYGAAAVGQAVASRRLPPAEDGFVRLTLAALRDRLMLVVIASYLVGAALHLAAIELTPLYLAQAGIAASLPVTALVAAVYVRERLTRLDWAAIVATGVGIALLAVAAGDAGSGDHEASFVVGLYVGLALVFALGLAAYRADGPWSGATLGLLAGAGVRRHHACRSRPRHRRRFAAHHGPGGRALRVRRARLLAVLVRDAARRSDRRHRAADPRRDGGAGRGRHRAARRHGPGRVVAAAHPGTGAGHGRRRCGSRGSRPVSRGVWPPMPAPEPAGWMAA